MAATRSMEDYLERIFELMQEKGYARVSDIASSLEVRPPSVTRMIQKLDEEQFVLYEKYRGITLTPKGERIGKLIKQRHEVLERFLRLLGVDDETVIEKDIEGMEHHLSQSTLDCLIKLASFFADNPDTRAEYERHKATDSPRKDASNLPVTSE